MNFYDRLTAETELERTALLQSPVITDCLAGCVSRETYLAFLCEAYHHVRHTVPLLMGCGARLPEHLAWMQPAIVEYIEEEQGHEQWILNDIAACGGDADEVAVSLPSIATELMVSYAWDTVTRRNPIGFFGMVFVLEGTSVAIATRAAGIIRQELKLPARAFSYLSSHGSVDQKHIGDYERIVNRLDSPHDQEAVLHSARVFYQLYGDIFRDLPRAGSGVASHSAKDAA